MAKKIITLEEQKFLATNFPDLFQNLTTQEISVILEGLGLDQVVDPDGNVIARYNLDVTSSRATYITKDFNTTLTGTLYNYYQEASDKVTSWKWTRDSGNTAEDSDWSVGKNTREISLTEEDFTTRFKDREVSFTLTAYVGAVTYVDKIVFTKFQTFSKVQIKSSDTVFIESTPSIITLEAITEETISNYRWFVNNNFVGVGKVYNLSPIQVPAGGIVTIKVEADTLLEETITDILTIPRISNGDNGEPGVPGAPGSNSYTWIRYADNAEGLNMSEYPIVLGVPKEYLGLAPNKNTPIESNNPSDYIWSKYVGDEGIPGENGYMWIKYSEFENGRNLAGEIKMYDTPFIMEEDGAGGLVREDMVYMGIAYNKQTQQEANPNTPEGAPEQYVWAKIKGEDGRTPYTLDLSNDNVSVPSNADGTISNPAVAFSLAKTVATVYYGNEPVDRSEYTISLTASTGVTYTTTDSNHNIEITGLTQDVGQVSLVVTSAVGNIIISTGTFSIVKVKGTAIYEISPSVSVIKVINNVGQSPTLSPTAIEANILMNNGDTVSNVNTGKLTYKYIYANTPTGSTDDGTAITIGQSLELSNGGNPLFVEFKYFHPVSNILIDIERVPFIRDGVSGTSIEQRYKANTNPITPPAVSLSETNPTGWSTDMPVLTTGEVLWMIKATKRADTGTLVGTWSNPVRISGGTGPQGPQGINGTSGPSPRLLEFVQGQAYKNGGLYIDYAYYRSNDVNEGWYTVKLPTGHTPGTEVSQIYAGGIPDNTKFNKAPFSKEMSFGTVVAEQANLAGFLFRNNVLNSQESKPAGSCHPQAGQMFPNLVLDALQALIKFGDRMILSEAGLTLKDLCGKPRMVLQWDIAGIPILKFMDELGVTTWEAGKGGYKTKYVQITPETFTPYKGVFLSTRPVGNRIEVNQIARNQTCIVNSGDERIYYYNNVGYFSGLEPVGYYYNKGQRNEETNPFTPLENSSDGKIFTSSNYNSSLIANGFYLVSFDTFNYQGEWKFRCVWEEVSGGSTVGVPFDVLYSFSDFPVTSCTTAQENTWESPY